MQRRQPQDSFVYRKVTKSQQKKKEGKGSSRNEKRKKAMAKEKKVIDGNCSNCHVYERPQDTKPTERERRGEREGVGVG